jgi:hypothetical protein
VEETGISDLARKQRCSPPATARMPTKVNTAIDVILSYARKRREIPLRTVVKKGL